MTFTLNASSVFWPFPRFLGFLETTFFHPPDPSKYPSISHPTHTHPAHNTNWTLYLSVYLT
ncbi:hypothetical protein HOY82DRAFT_581524 [Tuber indicum]|nr:hypothetical protein HOY82DRAFT_581524 [Tuber indicum]